MAALVYRGAGQVRLETVPVPRIAENELLVRVAVCGVCPTDIKKIVYGSVSAPRIFGHETAGVVVRAGRCITGFRLGERVALHHHVPCRTCRACLHGAFAQCAIYKKTGITAGFEPAGGGFAEYVRVMSFVLPGVVKIPSKNTFLEGAFLEPVNTVLKAVRKLSLRPGDKVLIAGQGAIGLLFTQMLVKLGIKVFVTDLFESRLMRARKYGATKTVLVGSPPTNQPLRSLCPTGFDAAILTVPNPPLVTECLASVRGGAPLLLFAHTQRGSPTPVDLASVCMDEKDLLGSYSSDITLQSTVARDVFEGSLDVTNLVTHRFPLQDAQEAISLALRPAENILKIVVDQTGGPSWNP